MKNSFKERLEFVAGNYEEGKYDADKALNALHTSIEQSKPRRKWWTVVVSATASAALAFAAGFGVVSIVRNAEPAQSIEVSVQPEQAAEAHQFVFDNTPVADVLRELSDYYGCKLTTTATRKRLTATFNDDGVDSIVALIEATLGIDITVEK